ncbi:MAG: exosortase N [Bacteroidia bacterium]
MHSALLKIQLMPARWWLPVMAAALAVALSFKLLIAHVAPGVNFYLVLMSLPFAFFITDKNSRSWRWGILSFIALAGYFFLKVQTLYFAGFCLFLLFVVEINFGKISRIPVFLILLLSPFSYYVLNLVSFPLRLQLTALAGSIFKYIEPSTVVEGNVISTKAFEFTVDPACAGLNMIITSFILGLALLAYHQQKQRVELPFLRFVIYLLCIAVLILLGNLQRILSLVFFRSMPGTFSHEVIGLFCLGVMVLLPLYVLVPYIVRTRLKKVEDSKPFKQGKGAFFLQGGLLVLMGFYAITGDKLNNAPEMLNPVEVNATGYEVSYSQNEILTLQQEDILIYLKPCRSFYSSTHSPAICWKGSGFAFTKERTFLIEGETIFMAELTKGSTRLFTAWWYDNDSIKTTKQFEWRWKMLKGADPFHLVNISSTNEKILLKEVRKWLRG